jgi:rhodanese-related sulfurtransferase/glyoxylase-like metal-dependent hydrolase (beta-lactamase superfamily II)
MNIIPFVHKGLGNSSYLVGLDDDQAILVDPDRTAARYVAAAAERGWRIVAALETHVHADFITGAVELAATTEATIYHSSTAGVRYAHRPLSPGERVRVAGAEIEVIASPGHSPEHVSYVLRGAHGEPAALFSGGAMTAGGAARTDLVSPEMTEKLTRASFNTLRDAFAHLPDETLLLPTHGGGSFCSSGTTGDRTSTLGHEREANPLLMHRDEEEFVRWFPTTFPSIPDYFFRMRPANQAGPRLRREIAMPPALTPEEFKDASGAALIVDTRGVGEYSEAHIKGSLSNAFRDSFATWLGWLAPADARLLFVLGDAPLERVIDESLLVGQESFAGYLAGGIEAWREAGLPLESLPVLDVDEAQRLADGATILDVREPAEFESGRIDGAINVPVGQLRDNLERLPRGRPVITYCGMGERSTSASSILERAGYEGVSNLGGGMDAWREAGLPVAA